MSRNYDNWERLVGAVLKREQYWEMAHAHSRNTSTASSVSLDFDELSLSLPREVTNVEIGGTSSRSDYLDPSQLISDSFESTDSRKGLDGNGLKSQNSEISSDASQNEAEWIEQYEAGVYVTILAFKDGSRDIKRARFSKRKFTEHQAETWWSENREKVYKKYNIRGIFGVSASNKAASRTRGVVSQGNNSKDSGPHQHDENGAKSSNSVGYDKGDVNQAEVEWIEKYEPGVYITLVALQDGSRDIKRARFSRRKFQEHQAETWWSKNREKVYEIYNIRGVDALK
ncbi:Protein BREVIS RADIX [Abeliophyllum distichum]|uniref:Protein BREVIS RADIX n=1 Tax=Abeliophyllum distichum TaxID=126358 RepID=A0ABD1VXP1_9LAMI